MSSVSGVTLVFGVDGLDKSPIGEEAEPVVERLNAWLKEHETHPSIREVTNEYGKHPQCHVLGAGLNYLDEDAFAAYVMSLPWRSPENVVLVIQPEHGGTRVWRPLPAETGTERGRSGGALDRDGAHCNETQRNT